MSGGGDGVTPSRPVKANREIRARVRAAGKSLYRGVTDDDTQADSLSII